ncbi:MAG: 16S rRNA (cytosine(1402)-N(4))-methyltransferase RsmH [Candidatus Kryptonium sp.]|nr:16S rRNA (cytosine(1402)-N(4))-methyltransferase RsmH [Candidatus Kryptonium sp.]MDW8108604.1 16S rRNA (cytosine(1402)-N(4))-methyltransferase RsmH [Candidatus Kryptonium sp.]
MTEKFFHIPVMLDEVMKFLITRDDGIYVDGTIGGGGHAEEILKRTKAKVIGFDIDPKAIEFASERLKIFKDRVVILNKNYADIKDSLRELGIEKITGFLLDLGVSSFQLDYGGGFSFRYEDKLDMRMDRSSDLTAEYILNNYSELEIADIIFKFGEEPKARAIAKEIVRYRRKKKIETTSELVKIIDKVASKKYRLKVLARVFQALRIAVNKELDNLKIALESVIDVLERGGRIVVISYHSLEDRIVKTFFKENEKKCVCSSGASECICGKVQVIKILTKKPIVPSENEISLNPRARSAKLRAGEKSI